MEKRLKELTGQPGVWLFVRSSNGWFKNVEILDVNSETITFRYESESESERKLWEKTTRIDNIAEVEVRLLVVPKVDRKLDHIRGQLSKLLEQTGSDVENSRQENPKQ
ncbi:MAG: DUF6679 family protein [Cyanobacteria bacterium J06628_6]